MRRVKREQQRKRESADEKLDRQVEEEIIGQKEQIEFMLRAQAEGMIICGLNPELISICMVEAGMHHMFAHWDPASKMNLDEFTAHVRQELNKAIDQLSEGVRKRELDRAQSHAAEAVAAANAAAAEGKATSKPTTH
jgi:hypothetical protein